MLGEPKTLREAVRYFAVLANCVNYVRARRWPQGVVCPSCGRVDARFVGSRCFWQCRSRHAKCQFSVKVGTIMEYSAVPLDKWLLAMWMVANCKNGVSSWEIHRFVGVTQKTAWFMLQRIRLAMQDDLTGGSLSGEVEVDETFIGGKARNMHKSRRARIRTDTGKSMFGGNAGKTIVLGMLERGKRVRATVIADRKSDTMRDAVSGHVERGSTVYSDEFANVWRMDEQYVHKVVNHLQTYAVGQVHTQGIENFWSLLKRGITGTYVSVEPFHLFRYVDEQAFRFNNRKSALGKELTDADRMSTLVSQIVGKRLTYAELTGKLGGQEEQTK